MNGKRILISTSSFGSFSREPLELLERAGAQYRLNPYGRTLQAGEIPDLLTDVDALIAGTERLSRQVLEGAPGLKVISRCGIGVDNVDLEAASELGILVTNTRSAHVDAVAELVLAGALNLLRGVASADRAVRAGEWTKAFGSLLRGRTVGLVGLGRIGKRLIELLAPFQIRALASDPMRDEAFALRHAVEYCELPVLLSRADLVSLHLPYHPDVHHLIDAAAIRSMKPGAFLINCARGSLVDEDALHEALTGGHLAGAYLDTFGEEPYRGPLADLPNVLLTPHIGSYAAEARVAMEREAVENLLRSFQPDGAA